MNTSLFFPFKDAKNRPAKLYLRSFSQCISSWKKPMGEKTLNIRKKDNERFFVRAVFLPDYYDRL